MRAHFSHLLIPFAALFAVLLLGAPSRAAEQGSNAALAEKLQNPIADLVSVQFQNNFNFGVGENNGTLYLMNFQPVIPLNITKEWNYIVRPVLPFISTSNVFGPGYVSGLGDLEIETFLSPVKPGPFGIIWGLGPTSILPTATQRKLGGDVMTLGPSGVALWQKSGWTVGSLITQ
ncbi:MAG: transporter, partial [Chthoniobacterales bacterium]